MSLSRKNDYARGSAALSEEEKTFGVKGTTMTDVGPLRRGRDLCTASAVVISGGKDELPTSCHEGGDDDERMNRAAWFFWLPLGDVEGTTRTTKTRRHARLRTLLDGSYERSQEVLEDSSVTALSAGNPRCLLPFACDGKTRFFLSSFLSRLWEVKEGEEGHRTGEGPRRRREGYDLSCVRS